MDLYVTDSGSSTWCHPTLPTLHSADLGHCPHGKNHMRKERRCHARLAVSSTGGLIGIIYQPLMIPVTPFGKRLREDVHLPPYRRACTVLGSLLGSQTASYCSRHRLFTAELDSSEVRSPKDSAAGTFCKVKEFVLTPLSQQPAQANRAEQRLHQTLIFTV